MKLTSNIAWNPTDTKSYSPKLRFWRNQAEYFFRVFQESYEKVMVETVINLRLNDARYYIPAGSIDEELPPASELLLECIGSGTYITLCNLLRVRWPREFRSVDVHSGQYTSV